MNTMLPLGAIRQGVNFLLPKIAAADSLKNIVKHNIHFLHCNRPLKVTSNKSTDIFQSSTLLQPVTPLVNLVCGLKYKGKLKLRCKDCYYVRRFDRLFVMCKSYPRHKQAALKPKERDTWILTYAMSTHKRPW